MAPAGRSGRSRRSRHRGRTPPACDLATRPPSSPSHRLPAPGPPRGRFSASPGPGGSPRGRAGRAPRRGRGGPAPPYRGSGWSPPRRAREQARRGLAPGARTSGTALRRAPPRAALRSVRPRPSRRGPRPEAGLPGSRPARTRLRRPGKRADPRDPGQARPGERGGLPERSGRVGLGGRVLRREQPRPPAEQRPPANVEASRARSHGRGAGITPTGDSRRRTAVAPGTSAILSSARGGSGRPTRGSGSVQRGLTEGRCPAAPSRDRGSRARRAGTVRTGIRSRAGRRRCPCCRW